LVIKNKINNNYCYVGLHAWKDITLLLAEGTAGEGLASKPGWFYSPSTGTRVPTNPAVSNVARIIRNISTL
jgi:hypothetical protein